MAEDNKMTKAEHKKRHIMLHNKLDELLADFIRHTKAPVSNRRIIDLMHWSHQQTLNPQEIK